MKRLLRHRNARLFLIGQAFSLFGDTALYLAVAIWVKSLTGSNAAAGLTIFFLAVPSLFSPLAGLFVDRVRRKPLMIATNLAIGGAVLLLLLVHNASQLWLIYVVAVLYGVSAVILGSAQSAFMTVMLPKDLLGESNAVLQTIREGLRLVAPLVGAGLYVAFGGGFVAVLDSATFVISAISLAAINVPEPSLDRTTQRFRTELVAGIRHILDTPALRSIIFTLGVALLVIGFTETIIFAVVSQGLHRPPSFLGILSSAQGVGAVGGGLTATIGLRKVGDLRLVAIGLAVFGLGDLFLIASVLPVVLVGIAIAGFGIPWAIVGFATAVQTRSPAELQGRVFSAADTVVGGPQVISIAGGAALSTVFDFRLLLGVVAFVTLGCSVYLALASRTSTLPTPSSPLSEVLPESTTPA